MAPDDGIAAAVKLGMFWRALAWNGAPWPTKMGNIASPWRYDAAVTRLNG
jgi:hypothetical protein